MNVALTGAGGNLGRVVLPALAAAGHGVRSLDFRPLETGHEFVRVDLRNPDEARGALAGVDAVVHAAALHGVHLNRWSPNDFWATNATGTFNVYEAARNVGVQRVVLASTMAVYGRSANARNGAWAVVTERSPALPSDVYGLSKLVCEHVAAHYAREEGIETTALRFGMFVPETFERYGFRLLFGGVDDRDVAQAVLLALEHSPSGGFECVNVMADTPFTDADAAALGQDAAAVLERHWPGSTRLAGERGLDLDELVWGWAVWPVDEAKRVLGYRPRYDFTAFLEALRRDDPSHYPFGEHSQWGV